MDVAFFYFKSNMYTIVQMKAEKKAWRLKA